MFSLLTKKLIFYWHNFFYVRKNCFLWKVHWYSCMCFWNCAQILSSLYFSSKRFSDFLTLRKNAAETKKKVPWMNLHPKIYLHVRDMLLIHVACTYTIALIQAISFIFFYSTFYEASTLPLRFFYFLHFIWNLYYIFQLFSFFCRFLHWHVKTSNTGKKSYHFRNNVFFYQNFFDSG